MFGKSSLLARSSPANQLSSPSTAIKSAVLHPTLSPTASAASRLFTLSRQLSTSTAKMAPTSKQYDFIVIGGGSGGSGCARRASGWYKKKTAIIDAGISGGCCVNVGYEIAQSEMATCR